MDQMGKTQDWKCKAKRGSAQDKVDEQTPEEKQYNIQVHAIYGQN